MDLSQVRSKLNMGINLKDIELRVTYYSRVSTDHLEQKKSLTNQNEHFEEMIKENVNWTYVNGYIDDGITGTSDVKRESFMRMIEDGKKDKFDLIITKEISRFSRNTLDSIKYTRELLMNGVAVLFVNDNINTALPDSELRLTIMASMAQDEIRRLSERVKFGMYRAQQKGQLLGNNQLYGYLKDKNGKLIVLEDEAKVVQEIFHMYLFTNMSLSQISRNLNNQNILTRLNKKWSTSSISRMIKNPKYKGYYCGRKVEVIDYMTKKIKYFKEDEWISYKDDKIPAIVDEEIWDKANEKIKKNQKIITKNIDTNIYNNKIYCAIHERPFYKRYFLKKKQDLTWICPVYLNHGKTSCDSPNIRQKELDFIIEDIIKIFSKEKEINLLSSIYEIYNKAPDDLETTIDKLYQKRNRLIELNMNDIISQNELKDNLKKINSEIASLKKEHHSNLKSLQDIVNVLKKKLSSKKMQSKIKDLLIDRIVAGKKDDVSVLDIYLNFRDNDIEKTYSFKRGWKSGHTKRYIVNYLIKCHYQNR